MAGLKDKVVKGAVWIIMQRFVAQGVAFVVTMVLARLLTPGDYGTVALLTIFTTVANSLVTSGMGMALVQKKQATDIDFNSLFYASLFMASILYVVLFIIAPFVADFYGIQDLKLMLRVLAISLFFNAMNSVQSAELSRKMAFHLSFKVSLVTCIVSAFAGIILAAMGFGPWAIVWSNVLTGLSSVVANWLIVAWRPRLMFSFNSLKSLFDFGWRVTAVGLIHLTYTNIYGLIIGKIYSKEDLSFVNKSHSLPSFAMGVVSSTICTVSFPALSQLQDSPEKIREAMRRMIQCTSFWVFPLMAGLAICADDIVYMLFGTQWLPCVPYMRLACFSFALQPLHDINLQAIAAMGKSSVFLNLQLLKTGFGCLMLLLFLRRGVWEFMAVLAFVSGPVSLLINTWHNRRFVQYSCLQQIRDVLPIVSICMAMASVLVGIALLMRGVPTTILSVVTKLVVQGVVGVVLYIEIAAFFRVSALGEYAHVAAHAMHRVCPMAASFASRLADRCSH